MRILIWTDAYHPDIGGLEVFCLELVRGLVKRGHEIEVITNRRGNWPTHQSEYEGIPVHSFRFTDAIEGGDLPLIRQQSAACSAILERFDPHVIHLNLVLASLFTFNLLQRKRRRRCVWTLHDTTLFRTQPQLAVQTLKLVDGLTAISEHVRQAVLDNYPEEAKRIETILNALPLPVQPSTAAPDHQAILAFGRIVPEKGFDTAIEAFAKVRARFPEATLTIAGDGFDRPRLEKLAVDMGAASHVRFTGWVNPCDIGELISEHALVVMSPRWQEPFGLAALQTAQAGRPIVATRSGGLPEIVVEGVTGTLVPIDGVNEMAQAYEKLLAQPALRRQWGEAARRRAADCFSFETFLAKHEASLLRHVS